MAISRFDKLSDRELVGLCNRGGRREAVEAFGSLYRRHRDYVMRVSLRLCPDTEIAADTLQETFLYLLRKFPPTGEGLVLTARLRSLLYPVARNLTLTALRQRHRAKPDPDLEPDRLPDPRTVDPHHENLERIMSRLSARHREVLLLRYVDDMRLKEIAEALELPVGTVKSRLHSAVRELRYRHNIA